MMFLQLNKKAFSQQFLLNRAKKYVTAMTNT